SRATAPPAGRSLPVSHHPEAIATQERSAARRKSAERCTASSTGINGAPPAAGRKPASVLWTERRKEVVREQGGEDSRVKGRERWG
ncbi:hypothetical protein DKP78_21310, partial [Enterococcus faecium]